MTVLLVFGIALALVVVFGLHAAGHDWRCSRCGRGGPMVAGNIDEGLLCTRCVCPAHPYEGDAIVRSEYADMCIPGCWTRIPTRDLRA